MKKTLITFLLFLCWNQINAQLRSPQDHLGYDLGDKYTLHYRVVDYFNHVAMQLANVKLAEYGRTYEDRPLLLAYIATEENMARLQINGRQRFVSSRQLITIFKIKKDNQK